MRRDSIGEMISAERESTEVVEQDSERVLARRAVWLGGVRF